MLPVTAVKFTVSASGCNLWAAEIVCFPDQHYVYKSTFVCVCASYVCDARDDGTVKCVPVFRHRYSVVGDVLERFFKSCCDACCDCFRRAAMQQYDHVYLRQVAYGIFHCPEIRSYCVGMDAQP